MLPLVFQSVIPPEVYENPHLLHTPCPTCSHYFKLPILLLLLFICEFGAVLGLCCCTGFPLASELGLLLTVASLVAEHRL